MIEMQHYYFKTLPDEPTLMSGLPLPDETSGIHFIECDFHPRLWEALQQMYFACKFTDCNWSPK